MRDEWNAGYEKGRDDYCCNHNCNQGRDCPLRKVKPIAWMVNNKVYTDIFEAEHYQIFTNKPRIPLYTHPVKELTDEEIAELANKYLYVLNDVPYANDIQDFARAILRKAQGL